MRMLQEPLIHFLAAGAVLFGAHSWLNPASSNAPVETSVRIGPGEIRWLRETFASQWRRPPTGDEMEGLLATLVEEELLAREARALRLDENDTVVRRRLAQKLSFLVNDTSRITDPTDDELHAFYAANISRFRNEPELSFEQIFFSPERRSQAAADAANTLSRMIATPPEHDLEIGDPLPLEESFNEVGLREVAAAFGPKFADSLLAMQTNRWEGPVQSAFGVHLVRVTNRKDGSRQPFDQVRDAVSRNFLLARETETRQGYLKKLQDKYRVVVERQPDNNQVPK